MLKSLAKKVNTVWSQASVSDVARQVRAKKLTYLSLDKIRNLEKCIKTVNRKSIPGDFIEAGVALGGGSIILASLMSSGRSFHGYDVFGLIPPPTSEKDDEKSKSRYETIAARKSKGIGGDTYYGYVDNLYDKVVENFSSFGLQVDGEQISLHRGLFEDTLRFEKDQQIALAHVDCDWYDPVKLCLERIYPALKPGGYIILDDYYDYGGCKQAVDEFMSGQQNMKITSAESNLVLMRTDH